MSKFFARVSDSDSDSSTEDDDFITPVVTEKKKTALLNFGSEENEVKRVVRTAADKQKQELTLVIKQIKNLTKIRDFSNLFTAFGELVRVFEKYSDEKKNVAFFHCLVGVDSFVSGVWEDRIFRQNMAKTASKSLVALRQKVKKYVKIYADDVANAESIGTAEELEDIPIDKENTVEKDNDLNQVGSRDSSDWGDTENSDISDDEVGSLQCAREYFLKKNIPSTDEKVKSEKKRIRKVECQKETEEKGWQTINSLGFSAEYQSFLKEEVSVSSVTKILSVLTGAKNKRQSSSRQKVKLLNELLTLTESRALGLPLIIKVRLSLAAAAFESNLNHLNAMKPDHWDNALIYMSTLAKSLDEVDFDIDPQAEEEEFENSPFVIRFCVVSLVERLDEEFIKMLKGCDPYGDEYINRLKDEVTVTSIVDQVSKYVQRRGTDSARCRIILSKIGHLYYKLDKGVFESVDERSSIAEMDRLCKFVYVRDNSHVLRTRAILAQIYHFALHDRWIQARDLMLMSHLQESIQHSDPRTQIMFNRTMTQVGLCAFRVGRITEAHSCLADLMTSGRVKELLGQGFLPFRLAERTREQELRERQLQAPFHMHIPLELVEFVYLVSAMVIDVPYMTVLDPRRRIISKPLYQMLRMIDKQCLVGPPESLREYIAAACKALRSGQWQLCYNLLVNPKMTAKVWNKIQNPLPVQKMLEKTIQSAALLTFVLSYTSVYDSLSIAYLAEMFNLEASVVSQKLASIITDEELAAALDEPTGTLVPQQKRHTLLHCLAVQHVEKLTLLMDINERSCRFGQKAGFTDIKTLPSF